MSKLTKIVYLSTSEVPEEPPVDPPPDPRDTTAPPTPANLRATGGTNQISLACDSVVDLDGPPGSIKSGLRDYGWYVSSSTSGPYVLLRRTTVPNTIHSGLAASTTRYYRVSARDNAGNESPLSFGVSATTAAPVGNQPPVWVTAEFQAIPRATSGPTTLRLQATDPEADPITYAAVTLPAGWTLTELTGNPAGALLTIPEGETLADYTVEATASDTYIPPAEGLANIEITSAVGGTLPWTFGMPFKEGDIPSTHHIGSNFATFQAEVRNRWGDGSVKYAVLSSVSGQGFCNLRSVEGDAPTGTPVAEPTAAYLAANVVVTLTGDGAGTYTPGPAREAGIRAWNKAQPSKRKEILGPVMSEFHYYSPTTDAHLAIFWYVRAYVDGSVEVETVIENGWLLLGSPATKNYSVTVTIGGTERFAQTIGFPMWKDAEVRVDDYTFRYPASSLADYFQVGGTVRWYADIEDTFTVVSKTFVSSGTNVTVDKILPVHFDTKLQIDGHCNHARWSRVDWVGTDPQILPKHSGRYIQDTYFTPNYYDADGSPTESTLNKLVAETSDEPFARCSFPVTMGAAGTNAEPLERNAIFYVKTGDARAYRGLIARARAAGRYGFHYRDETTGDLPVLGSYASYAYGSGAPFKDIKVSTGSLRLPLGGNKPPIYSKTHGSQTAYLAYILEGRQSFLDEVEFNTQSMYWQVRSTVCTYNGQRIPNAGVTAYAVRGAAWSVRMLMEGAVCLPDDHPRRQQYLDQLAACYGYYHENFVGKNNLGAIQPSTGYNQGTPTTGGQQFMQMFWIVANAWAYQLIGHLLSEADRTKALECVEFFCKRVVGIVGDSSGYCYRTSGYYAPTLALGVVDNVEEHTPAEFNAACLADYAAVYAATASYDPAGNWVDVVCEDSTALVSVAGSGYNANVLTTDSGSWYAILGAALSWAVDFGVTDAATGRARLEGASNWKPQGTSSSSGFRNLPDWGIYPRA